ncbi:MAG: hypothetical protein U9N40_02740 [Euryarchaeota archaeon]|nr:hypothetical protein [Euryarchaeota archaeon]
MIQVKEAEFNKGCYKAPLLLRRLSDLLCTLSLLLSDKDHKDLNNEIFGMWWQIS